MGDSGKPFFSLPMAHSDVQSIGILAPWQQDKLPEIRLVIGASWQINFVRVMCKPRVRGSDERETSAEVSMRATFAGRHREGFTGA